MISRFSRVELLVFLATFFAFAYFNQGGGWNQNGRFAEVRAIVEEGRLAIDDYLVYLGDPETHEPVRMPLDHAEYDADGQRHRLAWVDMEYNLHPITTAPQEPGVIEEPMVEVCSSGDVGYVSATGHFHPNKPPGTTFFAVPGYWLIFHLERAFGVSPDHWWTLTLNAWLTTILSVGLFSALGCVCFFRLAREFAGGAQMPALCATFSLAFGTTFFPFATVLFDHCLTASLLVMTLYFLRRESMAAAVLAGACAGAAVLTNYVAGAAVVALGAYALCARGSWAKPSQWDWRRAVFFALGGLPLAFLLGWYHQVNFGSPLALATDFQSPVFKDAAGALGMFTLPEPYVGALLLVSPFRGVLLLCPVLLAGLGGLFVWLRQGRWAAEMRLCVAIFGIFFIINMAFNGYHAGYSAGPRYLVPGLPFLAFPLVVAFVRWRVITWLLMALSIGQQLLLTATDAQNPLAVGGHARLDESHRRDDFFCSIVAEYTWPLFVHGQAKGLLQQLLEQRLDVTADELLASGKTHAQVQEELGQRRAEWRAAIACGDKSPFLLAAVRGPVSVNTVGIYDGLLGYGIYPMDSVQGRWASCNLGEFLFPSSRWSLLPLLVITGGLAAAAGRLCRSGAA